ncbi:hypothetical protein LCGC14_0223690 [marine sediment metagenome]|uniref:Uncharacterized protein n=1 Tax=marine sediment metagenome TaxID=412755 RepID=A0A0F9WWQ3_9ZZZZ
MGNIKKFKIITDLVGYTVGAISSLWMGILVHHFFRYGGVIFYEESRAITIIEGIAAAFGVSYFGYKIAKMMTKKEIDKYIRE